VSSKKETIKEGQLFAVPVGNRFAIGLIARYVDDGILAYFFNRQYEKLPGLSEITISKENIIYIKIASSLGLEKGRWPILGVVENWNRNDWPVPVFYRIGSIDDAIYRIYYDDNLTEIKREFAGDLTSIEGLPKYGVAGYGFVEKKLDDIFENRGNS
jgi:hypothetical protein